MIFVVRRLLPGLCALLWLAGCAAPTPAPQGPVAFTILHTNDHHGRFWRGPAGEGGLAGRKTLVDAVRAEVAAAGGHVLLLDAGDVNTGVPESDLQAAEPDFRGMSLLRYDAMAVGNHEFDRTQPLQHRQRNEWSSFPWLSANVKRGAETVFEAYRVLRVGPLRVAVLGLTTEDTMKYGVADRYPGLNIEPALKAAGHWVPRLRREAEVVLALTHIGHYPDGRSGVSAPGDVELARSVSGIDVVVGGHSHSIVCMLQENLRRESYEPGAPCAPDRQNGTWILQAGDRGRFVGRADFHWQQGRLTLQRYRLLAVNLGPGERVAEDSAALDLLQPYQARGTAGLDEVMGQTLARFDGERSSVRTRRTAIGSMLAEVMREAVGADAALLSSGGIRASLPAGAVTRRDLLTVQPFGNRVVVVSLSGAELAEFIHSAARMTPGSGAFAQYSGLDFRTAAGEVHDIRVAGQPLEPSRRYRLALPSFVAGGGDGYRDWRQHPGYHDTGRIDHEVLAAYLARHGALDPARFAPEADLR